jgi:catechol 2,3-dioxygenase-like lactoylglutathione lyase family enzyme
MKRRLGTVALVVRDYDEALRWFVDVLGFVCIEDRRMGPEKRWLVVAPANDAETGLLLARAVGARQEGRVGDQTGGRVFLFLHTDDFDRDYALYRARGVRFMETPRTEPYGKVAVFEDLYGNRWDLLQLNREASDDGPQ